MDAVLHRLRLGHALEQDSGSGAEPIGMGDRRRVLPDEPATVRRRVGLSGEAFADHPTDELLILRLDRPAERVGPPVGEHVRLSTVHHDLERVRHRTGS
jgi:hypothetical protein